MDAPHFDYLKPLVTPDMVNKHCSDGRILLVLASERGRVDVVEFLLQAEASVHTPCIPPCTDTPLIVAARHGRNSVVELFVESRSRILYNCGPERCFLLASMHVLHV